MRGSVKLDGVRVYLSMQQPWAVHLHTSYQMITVPDGSGDRVQLAGALRRGDHGDWIPDLDLGPCLKANGRHDRLADEQITLVHQMVLAVVLPWLHKKNAVTVVAQESLEYWERVREWATTGLAGTYAPGSEQANEHRARINRLHAEAAELQVQRAEVLARIEAVDDELRQLHWDGMRAQHHPYYLERMAEADAQIPALQQVLAAPAVTVPQQPAGPATVVAPAVVGVSGLGLGEL